MKATINNTRVFALVLLLAAVSLPLEATDRVSDASSGKAPAKGDVVLFPFDDYALPWRENLKVTLQQPKKYSGNPILRAGSIENVDGYGMLAYGTVIKVNGKFRMWYLSTPRADSRIPGDVKVMKTWRPVSYAESTDGIHWVRPNLGLVEFRGSKNNNIVRIEPENTPYAHSFDFVAVWYEPHDPDSRRRYKMAYIFYDPLPNGSTEAKTATAVSADGLSWKLVHTEPIQTGNFENSGLIKFDGLYYLSGQDFPPFDGSLMDGSGAGRVMKIFFSPDFNHWSSGRALAWYRCQDEPKPTSFGEENHMGAGLWDRGNVIVGFYGQWHGGTIHANAQTPLAGLKVDLGLIVSDDAIHYREPVRNFVMVPHGTPDDWDSNAILQANAFANTDTQTLIWYSHWYTSRPANIPPLPAKLDEENTRKADAIGLLTLPRDRFGYFSKLLSVSKGWDKPLDKKIEASVLSRSLRFARPARLYLNVDEIEANAPLEIALVDDAEQPLPGYTAKLKTNSLKAPVRWAAGEMLPVNRSFRVKVIWPAGTDSGKLYAIYIEQQ